VRGFEITPETATLAPGETADFDALLYGGPHPSVTWSAAGGEISASGIYTAGDTEGTFNVTATSNLSGASESAAVTIGAGTGGALDVQDLVGTASAIGGTCPFGQISDPQSAGLADLPGFSLLASAPSDGSGTSNLDFSFTEDSGTGVVTIETDSDSVTTGVVCDGGPPPVANGQGQGHMRFDFDLPSAYAASLSGSVSGAGDYEVSVRLLSLPSGDNTFYCLILHDSPGEPMSCPGGGALSDSGSLPAGSWRLDVLQDSEGWLQFPSSSAGFDLTLTLTPE